MSEMGRLQYFLTVDDVSRHRSALAAMAVGFAVGLAMQVLGKPFKFSAYVAIAANAAMFTIGIWRYCRSTPKKVVRPAPIPIRRTIVRGLLAAAAIGVLSVVPIQRVEAGVLDRRLRALMRDKPLSPESANGIAANLGVAEQWNVILPSDTLVQVRDKIKTSALEAPELGPVSKAAISLTRYWRQILSASDRGTMTELVRAADLTMANPANYDAALSAINHAIDLSSGNPRLRAEIFLQRAVLHLRAKKFDEALADAETAEALGAIDLDAIFLVEGVTLSLHEDPKDLRQAVRLLTLADQIESPVDPFDYRIIVLYSRCSAYYKLGEFRETVADAHRLLAILPANAHAVQTTYKLLTVSYLRLGEYKSAQSTAIEYANRIGGPEARQWLDIVNYYPKNPQLALNELVRVISSP